jgi:hypothetical protein
MARYFLYNGCMAKFLAVVSDVAAKAYQEMEFSLGESVDGQADAASASALTFAYNRYRLDQRPQNVRQFDAHFFR